MAQSENALVLLSDMKDQGGSDLEDVVLVSLIEIASEEIVGHLKRPLLFEANIEEMPDLEANPGSRHMQAYGDSLWLSRYPVHSVSSVTIRGEAQTVATVTPADLPLRNSPSRVWRTPKWDAAGKLFRSNGWPMGLCVVNYSGGFKGPLQEEVPSGVAPLPLPIQEACILTALRVAAIVARDGEIDLVQERTVGGWEQRWGNSTGFRGSLVPDAARPLLKRYRRKWFS